MMPVSLNNPVVILPARRWVAAALLTMASLSHAQGTTPVPPVAAATTPAPLKTIAIMDFELLDQTGDTTKDVAQKARLQLVDSLLRSQFTEHQLYRVADSTPAVAMITDFNNRFALHDCNGCDVDIGNALHVDRVLTAWVQKVSNLILNINIQIRDVKTGLVVLNKSVDIRGNTDESWTRGIRYMVRDMVEKAQANR